MRYLVLVLLTACVNRAVPIASDSGTVYGGPVSYRTAPDASQTVPATAPQAIPALPPKPVCYQTPMHYRKVPTDGGFTEGLFPEPCMPNYGLFAKPLDYETLPFSQLQAFCCPK